jgi:hypothetical protein
MGAMDVATELGKRSLSLSGEAISGALDFADTASRRSNEFADTASRRSYEFADDANRRSYEFADDANRRSYEFADDANRRSYDFAQSNQEATIKILDRNADVTEATRVGNANLARDLSNTLASKLEKNTQSADVTLIQTVGKYAAVIAGIVAVAVFLSRRNTAR